MFKATCVSVLVALVCLSSPSIGRSWGGSQFDHKSWVPEPNDGPRHRSDHGWNNFGSSEEGSWESKEDYQDYHRGQGYGDDKFDHFGYHHGHGGHGYGNDNFDHFGHHHNHEDHYDHHNHGGQQGHNHQGHESHKSGNKHDYHGHRSRPESNVTPSFGLPQNDNLRTTPAQNTGFKPNPDLSQNNQNRGVFSRNGDRLVFPEDSQTPDVRTTRSPLVPSSPSPPRIPAVTQPPSTSTTISSLVLQDIVRCIRDCPATPEFNPVCGTNNVTYNNLGLLECTRNCGVNVALKRRAPCPQPLPPAYFISIAMQSTETPIVNARGGEDKKVARSEEAAPTVKPTRFTNTQIDMVPEVDTDRRT